MSMQAPTKGARRKAVTLQDVASRAGIAKSTASIALNGKGWVSEETRALVLQAAREMNFEIDPSAKRLSLGRDYGTIALLSQHLDGGVGSEKAHTIQSLLSDLGYNAPIQGYGSALEGSSDSQLKLIRGLCRQKPHAIICNVSEKNMVPLARRELQLYREEGGYLLCYDWPLQLDCDRVIFDREDNTYRAAHHLLELGHRKLGLFDAATGIAATGIAATGVAATGVGKDEGEGPRLRGFTRALGEFGLPLDRRWVYAFGSYNDCEGGGKYLAAQFLALPASDRPTALCVVNDLTALVFVTVLRENGMQVPRDVSVVGHDDLMIARYAAVPLTTVSQPVKTIARHVVELIEQRLGNGSTKHSTQEEAVQEIVVRGELMRRHSTAAI